MAGKESKSDAQPGEDAGEKPAPQSTGSSLRNVIIALLAVAILFFAGAYILFLNVPASTLPPGGGNNTPSPGGNGSQNGTPECDDDCYIRTALRESNPDYCGEVSALRSDDCWAMFSHEDLDACLRIRKYETRKDCLDSISFAQKNESLCELLQGADVSLCKEKINPPCMDIAGQSARELCLALRSNNSEYCTSSECTINYAKEREDEQACESIELEAERLACSGIVKSYDACAQSSGYYTSDYCYQLVAQYTDSYGLCSNIKQSGLYKFNCYTSAAIWAHDYSYCEKNDLEYRWTCYTNYSIAAHDIEGCLAINMYATGSKDGCIDSFAKAFNEPAVCKYASTIYIRTNCYAAVIMGAEDLTLQKCADVEQESWRDKCYSKLAQSTENKLACDYIQGSDEKARCEGYFTT